MLRIVIVSVLAVLAVILASVFAFKNVAAPAPQPPCKKAYIAKYLVHPLQFHSAEHDYFQMVYSDGAGHILFRNDGTDKWWITDYVHRANYNVDKSRAIYTHAELINPQAPIPFISKALVDENSCQLQLFHGSEKVGEYLCHKYGGPFELPFFHDGHRQDDLGTYWFCPDINCCAKSEIGPGLNGWGRTTLVDYKNEQPPARLFDLSGFKEVPCSQFYKSN